jgi:hypothetical protein
VFEVVQGYSVDNIDPSEPVGLTVSYAISNNQLTLDWQPNSDDDLSHYEIMKNGVIIGTPNTSELDMDIELETGITIFSLRAVDIHGNESNSIEEEIYIVQSNLESGNSLISLPGYLENTNSQDLMNEIINNGTDVVFLLTQGFGLFNTADGWSGNLTNVNPYSGYWINTSNAYTWDLLFEEGSIENCESYPTSVGNNLVSFKWGTGSSPTLEALGGEAFATENFNFILGQGFGLFNTAAGWSGNLTNLIEGKGYWLNIIDGDIDFR